MPITLEEYEKKKKKKQQEDYNIVSLENYQKQKGIKNTFYNDNKSSGYFKSSSFFDDGYDKGDVSKTAFYSLANVLGHGVKGAVGAAEGISDFVQRGAALGASMIGANNLADIWNKSADVDLSGTLLNPTLKLTEDKSVFGDSSNALAEGVGNYAGMAGLQAIGVPWQLTAGAGTAANSLKEAQDYGASTSDAVISSLVSAAGEIGSEYLFGGLGKLKGTGALDDVLVGKLTKGIKNNFIKNMAQFGLKSAGEGVEEIASGFIDALGKKKTYMDDKKLSEIYSSKDAYDDFIAGTLVSAISGIALPGQGNVINNIKNGRSVLNGLTQDEQKAFDNEVNKRYNEKISKNTENLSTRQKNQIKTNIEEQVYQDLFNDKINIRIDTNTDNDKINQFRKSANQYWNNSKESIGARDVVEKVIKDKNYNITLDPNITTKSGEIVAGRITTNKNGEVDIRLNPNSNRTVEFLLTHEITHAIDTKEMRNLVVDYASKNSEFNQALESLKQTYETNDVSDEVLADISGQLLGNQEFILNLSTSKPNIFKRMYNAIISLANKITGNSKESLFIRDLKNKWENAYRTQNNNLDVKEKYLFTGTKGMENAIKNSEDNKFLNDLYKKATKLKEFHKSNEEIRKSTLWFQGTDGKWRFEIPDNESKLKTLKPNSKYKLSDILDHRDLYEMYPNLKNTKIVTTNISSVKGKKVIGQYFPLTGIIEINNKYLNDSKAIKNTILHEIQHKIQKIENFELGNNGKDLKSYLLSLGEIESSDVEFRSDYNINDIQNITPEVSKSNPYHPITKTNQKLKNIVDEYYNSTGGKYENFKNNKTKNKESFRRRKKYNISEGQRLVNLPLFNSGLKELDNSSFILVNSDGKKIDVSDLKQSSSMELRTFKRKYNKENINAYRGVSENSGANPAFYGLGLYTTLDKNYASQYGDVIKIDSKQLPDNPLHFKTQNDFNIWEQELARELGIRKKELYSDNYGVEQYIKQLGYDGLMIGTGKDTDLISFKNVVKNSIQNKNEWRKFIEKYYKATGTRTNLKDIKKKETDNINLPDSTKVSENDINLPKNPIKESSYDMDNKPTRHEVIQKNRTLSKNALGSLFDIKDKKKGIFHQINTMKRILRDIMPQKKAKRIYDTFFKTITENNAKIEINKQKYVERIQKFNLTDAESSYVQMLGELKHNPETTLTQSDVSNFYNKNTNRIDKVKCERAVSEFRKIYDELIVKINDVLTSNGYKPIEYRKGYFPHFIEEKATSPIGKLAEKLGWKVKKGQLPTDIAGITDQFKPGKSWTTFSQQRTGDATDYNALKGLDNYLDGAMNVIYHTEDIQKLRALENEIRYQYSEKGVQEKIDEIYNDDSLDMEEKNDRIITLTQNIRNSSLGNFVTELRNYTDNIANKKAFGDRSMEQSLGRDTYSIMKNVNSRVSANMVGANISSALTNFIPITQAWSQCSSKNLMRGMYESIKNCVKDDGFSDKSTFLINRTKQADRLYKSGIDKINDKLSVPFEAIDSFTSNTIVRAKYYDNIEKGMTETKAIDNANEFAKDVMAGRSKGDMPTIFNRQNPLTKLFTAFQLEVNNQYSYMFKDIPADLADEGKEKLVGAFIKMFFGAYLYNIFSEKITGRKSAFSPIDMAIDDINTLSDENLNLGDKIKNISTNTASELPFVGGMLGGGRLPIQAAIPYNNPLEMVTETFSDLGKVFDEEQKDTAIKNLQKEWSKPVYYLALPFAGGQIKKTIEGLSMYDENLPVAGSYTNSGKLRFEAPTDELGKMQAAIFGQYASKNARDYFNNSETPLTEKQINTALEGNFSISEYREYKKGINEVKKDAKENKSSQSEAVYNYVYNLPIDDSQKNVLLNNTLGYSDTIRDKNEYIKFIDDNNKTYWYDEENNKLYNRHYKEVNIDKLNDLTQYSNKKDISNYGDYSSLDEFNYAIKNPTKYNAIKQITEYSNYVEYKNDIEDISDEFSEELSNAITSKQKEIINNKKKKAIREYINSLDLNKYQKLMLEKICAGYSIKRYRSVLSTYIDSLDLSITEKEEIDNELFG